VVVSSPGPCRPAHFPEPDHGKPGRGIVLFVGDEVGGDRRATPAAGVGSPSGRAQRLAVLAVALLGIVAAALVAAILLTRGLLLAVVVVGAAVVVAAACGWWVFTTRRRWKRRLNLVFVVLAVILAVLAVALFSGTFAGYVALLVVLTVGYADVARRALSAGAVEAPGLSFRPARPWLLMNPRSGVERPLASG
jgi:hypothetical protein